MTDDPPPNPALLPAGLRDLLPPDADTEAAAMELLMAAFAGHGYQRVQPPLIEFEESLLAGSGAAVSDQTFRVLDPDSHRMMGVRADTTPQVARIATTRLAAVPRPLRLSYAGLCLRVRGSQLDPDRQIAQAGIELIGADSPTADAEIVEVGVEALAAIGLTRISVDLTMPTLIPALFEALGLEGAMRARLARALDRKDAAEVRARSGGDQALAATLTDLLFAAGPMTQALPRIAAIALPPPAAALAERLAATAMEISARVPGLRLTVDPVEFRGFRYHTGVAVTVYAPGRHEELGRGGRYVCGDAEPATGLTLYPDAMLRAAPAQKLRPRVYVPAGADRAVARSLRGQGFATIAAIDGTLGAASDPVSEARRLGCSHFLADGAAVPIAGD